MRSPSVSFGLAHDPVNWVRFSVPLQALGHSAPANQLVLLVEQGTARFSNFLLEPQR
jgi:hypothetical protein